MLPGPAVPGSYLVSVHILWAILSTSTVHNYNFIFKNICVCVLWIGHEQHFPSLFSLSMLTLWWGILSFGRRRAARLAFEDIVVGDRIPLPRPNLQWRMLLRTQSVHISIYCSSLPKISAVPIELESHSRTERLFPLCRKLRAPQNLQ